ncbi:MAG: hypothetical protein WCK48_02050 [bacterium]
MSQYFDKDFVKFLLGFIVIVLISCAIIIVARVYESGSDTNQNPVVNTARP